MDIKTKAVLYLNLERKTAEVKIHTDLSEWVGGLGTALKLFEQNLKANPLVLTNGPLTPAFPFAGKTCALFRSPFDKRMRETYVGGKFGAVLFFAGYSGLVILGKAGKPLFVSIRSDGVFFGRAAPASSPWQKEGLAGLRSILQVSDKEVLVDDYFRFKDRELSETVRGKNLVALVVSGSQSFPFKDKKNYEDLHRALLAQAGSLKVNAASFPSCFGCPLGCREASLGEGPKDNLLAAVLIGCRFAEKLYNDIPKVFSCLNSLGLTCRHEDLEYLTEKIKPLRESLQ